MSKLQNNNIRDRLLEFIVMNSMPSTSDIFSKFSSVEAKDIRYNLRLLIKSNRIRSLPCIEDMRQRLYVAD